MRLSILKVLSTYILYAKEQPQVFPSAKETFQITFQFRAYSYFTVCMNNFKFVSMKILLNENYSNIRWSTSITLPLRRPGEEENGIRLLDLVFTKSAHLAARDHSCQLYEEHSVINIYVNMYILSQCDYLCFRLSDP